MSDDDHPPPGHQKNRLDKKSVIVALLTYGIFLQNAERKTCVFDDCLSLKGKYEFSPSMRKALVLGMFENRSLLPQDIDNRIETNCENLKKTRYSHLMSYGMIRRAIKEYLRPNNSNDIQSEYIL